MDSPAITIQLDGPTLNTVSAGLAAAQRVIGEVGLRRVVTIDMSTVERLTPSFANALVMTIIEAIGMDRFRSCVRVVTTSDFVLENWNKAVDRYERGVRLSNQRPEVA